MLIIACRPETRGIVLNHVAVMRLEFLTRYDIVAVRYVFLVWQQQEQINATIMYVFSIIYKITVWYKITSFITLQPDKFFVI